MLNEKKIVINSIQKRRVKTRVAISNYLGLGLTQLCHYKNVMKFLTLLHFVFRYEVTFKGTNGTSSDIRSNIMSVV